MAKDPAFLFYYQDFLVGTAFMTPSEKGNYISILCHMADKGKLSEDEIISICSGDFSARLRSKFMVDESGFFLNQRLLLEVEKRKNFSNSRRLNRLSKKHMKKKSKTYVRHMENENENENKDLNKVKKDFGESGLVKLTGEEYSKLVQRFGQAGAEAKISHLENAIGSKGYKYKSHYHTILNWASRDGEKSPVSGNALNLNKKQQANMEALNDFVARKTGAIRP